MGIYPLVIKKRNSPRLNQQKYGELTRKTGFCCINWHKCQQQILTVKPRLFLLHSPCKKQTKHMKGKLIQYKPKLCVHPKTRRCPLHSNIQNPTSVKSSQGRDLNPLEKNIRIFRLTNKKKC